MLIGILFLVIKTEYYWKQISGLVFLAMHVTIILLAAAVVVMMILSSVRIYKESGPLKLQMFLPLFIYFIGLSLSCIDPFHLNAESLQSRVILKGNFKGIMNDATITFRRNGYVEFEGKGFLGYPFFYGGTWSQNGDTLTTVFGKNTPIPWGDRLIIYRDNKLLLPPDSIAVDQYFPGFLLEKEQIGIVTKPHEEKAV